MIFLEGALFLIFFLVIFPFLNVYAEINQNATVRTHLEIGKSSPIIREINIHDGSVVLIPNSTRIVNCTVEIEDFDGAIDISNVSAEFFDNSISYYGDDDAGNHHYTNDSCYIDAYGDYNAVAHCFFEVWYYANAGEWNCSVRVEDHSGYYDEKSNTTQVEKLLAVGLPDEIDYGLVNASQVSDEVVVNVTNFGNVQINLSLTAYSHYEGDGVAMNCSFGSIKNISIEHEKYNLTSSNPGELNLAGFDAVYFNLSSTPIVRKFELNYKQDDTSVLSLNSTYWRVYVPGGVAGSCSGNIIFGAVEGEGV